MTSGPHGIAMLKGLYFANVVFSFFLLLSFSRRIIYEVTERISTKLGHIFSYNCYLKNLVQTPQAFNPHGLGGKKNAFLDQF